MLLAKGDKLLITHRRLYERDAERFFIGTVDAYEDGVVKVTGYTWQHDIPHGIVQRKEDKRTKLISLASGHVICYALAASVDIETVRIEQRKQHMLLTNSTRVLMDLTDRLPSA